MTIITSLSQLDLNKSYTYNDYSLWQLKERVELIKGKILAMSPAPTRTHQRIVGEMYVKFYNILKKRPCEAYLAPFDVRLPIPSKGKEDTVVQPDLCVICDPSKLDEKGCTGTPDLIVEILSKGNSKREMNIKFDLYQEAGVLEYWIIDPLRQMILLYRLENGKFITGRPFIDDDVVYSHLFPELGVCVNDIFNEQIQ